MTVDFRMARQHWTKWAASAYSDPTVAGAAAAAVLQELDKGAAPAVAEVAGHQAAIKAGGEYRCRPDRTSNAKLLCALLALVFIPTSLAGLSTNPTLLGYVFLTAAGGGPILGLVGLVLATRNSCFFVMGESVGRRNWLGRVVAEVPRRTIRYAVLQANSGGRYTEKSLQVIGAHGEVTSTTATFWSDARIHEFVAVADLQLR